MVTNTTNCYNSSYTFSTGLTKFLKHTERYHIGEKIRPAIPREVPEVLDIPTVHIKVHAQLLLYDPDPALASLVSILYSGSKAPSYVYGKSYLGTLLLLSAYFSSESGIPRTPLEPYEYPVVVAK